jgi:hypothetical protein
MAMYMDSEGEVEQKMCYDVIMSFVEGSKFKWVDTANGDAPLPRPNATDLESTAYITNFLDLVRADRNKTKVAEATDGTS